MSSTDTEQHSAQEPLREAPRQAEDAADNTIEPIDFRPVDASTGKRRKRLPLLPLLITSVVLLGGLVLWFLLTSRAVTITATPDNAQIKLSGGLTFALADHYLLRPGQYRLQVTAAGYIPYDNALEITDDALQTQSITLKKMPGHLDIVTTPDSAAVIIDGEPKGVTPLTIARLAAGDYQLVVSAPRYLPIEQTITIEGLDRTQQLLFELKPNWGDMTFTSEPTGATVTVAGSVQGTTPLTVPILATGEQVEISLPAHKTWQKTLSVPAGEHREWPPVTLLPADARVHISSRPSGANITINGQYSGTTPTSLALTPDKGYKVSLFLNGYQRASRQLKVESGTERKLSIDLKPRLGTLNITAKPLGAQLYVGGKLRGKAPLSLTLPARPWQLEVRHTGYTSQARTVTPKPGIEQKIDFTLKTEDETRWARIPAVITSPAGQKLKLFQPNTTFTMGASRREQGRRANEILRDVTLKRPFYLSTSEVSNEQFSKFSSRHSSSNANGNTLNYPSQPVVNLSWTSAALFCNWMSKQDKLEPFYIESNGDITGIQQQALGYRLPTEAEWAWAARRQADGSMLKFPWGSDFPPTSKVANIADRSAATLVARTVNGYNDGHIVSAPVASYAANRKGLYDMGGNVSEWLNDYYTIALSTSGVAAIDPVGSDKGEYRVIRGASWRSGGISELRLAFRNYDNKARDDLGFRVARYAK